ncbi:hypothetical protein CHU92_02935 [Flavobacterium cyanobacteriorum]|uniref:Hydrolase n=1 Tax=Flavobacterium cyanobacteriorum TaxID=2022802 RepID=A0A255ZQY0_9FLAO|nr:hypothetical protein [Flavobacterium cyanobacteriorum]OYQ43819.1 hypothetical protein CHU92_02935 [Flavobacterium cyanobacteriorum]
MKKNLYLYLFIFSLLINIFTYVYFDNKAKFNQSQLAKAEKNDKAASDSIRYFKQVLEEANYFSLENNDNAAEYFAGQDIAALSEKVRAGIDKYNQNKNGNPLVEYPAIGGVPFLINKIKILNHRWIIADFSNGKAWGEVLIKYFVDSNGQVTYEPLQTILYSDTVN